MYIIIVVVITRIIAGNGERERERIMIVIVIFQSCWMTPEGTPSMKIPGVPFGQVNGTVEVVSAEDSKGPVMGALVAAEISDNLP